MKILKRFIGLIISAFIVLLMEINNLLLILLKTYNYSLIPQENTCFKCGSNIENFDIEFPFCEQCTQEMSCELETNYTPPPEERSSAYR